MCIIAYIPVTADRPTNEILSNCWYENDDYAGFMYVDDQNPEKPTIRIHKYKTLKNFLIQFGAKYEEFGSHSPFILHFRMASHGDVSLDNCHPFYVDDTIAFCHNGTINDTIMDKTIEGKVMSDSRKFNEYILQELPKGWHKDTTLMELIKEFVSPSRLAILSVDKEVVLVNPTFGSANWTNGVWYSKNIPSAPAKKVVGGVVVYDPLAWYDSPSYNGYLGSYCEGTIVDFSADTDDKPTKFFGKCDGCAVHSMVRTYKVGTSFYQFCYECEKTVEDSAKKCEERYNHQLHMGGGC